MGLYDTILNTLLASSITLNFSWDASLVQISLLYIMTLVFSTNSLFYSLFYLLLEIIYFGFFLSIYQLELFTAFLWLAESIVIFVSFLLLFYVSVYDVTNNTNKNINFKKNFILFFFVVLFSLNMLLPSELEFFLPLELNISLFWDDFYEALNNDKTNDLFGLMLSFYLFNSFEFLIIGFLLLVGSMVCVNINKFFKNTKTQKYNDLFNILGVFKDSLKMLFMRKQNLVNQETHNPNTRVFKKK